MNAIAPVWDGNETWLVLGGGGLLAAFPLAYAIILPALYPPLIAMLLGLVFRGVAFEFRWRDPGHRDIWDAGFCLGSLVADLRAGHDARRAAAGHRGRGPRLCRRLVGLADAVQPADRRQPGRRLCPARRLLADLEDRTGRCRPTRAALPAGSRPRLLAAIGAVSLATLILKPQYSERWFDWPGLLVTVPMPLLVGVTGLFACGEASAAAATGCPSCSPWPCSCCAWPASPSRSGPTSSPAASPSGRPRRRTSSQLFMLVGAAVLVPMILAYTAWAYWVFRGKVGEEGYH